MQNNYLLRSSPYKKDFYTVRQRLGMRKQEKTEFIDMLLNRTTSPREGRVNDSKIEYNFRTEEKRNEKTSEKPLFLPPLHHLKYNQSEKRIKTDKTQELENSKHKKFHKEQMNNFKQYLNDLQRKSLAPIEKTEYLTLERKAIQSHQKKIIDLQKWKENLSEIFAVNQLIRQNQNLKENLMLIEKSFSLDSIEQSQNSFSIKKTLPPEKYIALRKKKSDKKFVQLIQKMNDFETQLKNDKSSLVIKISDQKSNPNTRRAYNLQSQAQITQDQIEKLD